MTTITKAQEARLLRDSVSPIYCQKLLELGVTNVNMVYWHMNMNGDWQLWSYQFDPFHYYQDTDNLIFDLFPKHRPLKAFAAFSTGDMVSALPPIIITSTAQNDWEVGVDTLYGSHAEQDNRLPDALARLLIRLLINGVYGVDYVNKKITNS